MDTVRSIQHLHAAYILAWCVHLGYVLLLFRGYVVLKREWKELRK